jgi:hypothetical protein
MARTIPFPDYSAPFWARLDARFISKESLVSKIHALELLESLSPYHHAKGEPIFHRIWRSIDFLQQIPGVQQQWLDAALLIFANVIYLPKTLLDDAWRGLFIEFSERELGWSFGGLENLNEDVQMHFFENDPSGMTAEFFHLNVLHGRLDNQKFARIEDTDKLADTLLDLLNAQKRDAAAASLRTLFSRAYWIILVDKSLSGHSLGSDLERLLAARSLAKRIGVSPPKVVVLCQVLTEGAERYILSLAKSSLLDDDVTKALSIYRAVFFDSRCSIHSQATSLIRDESILPALKELCRWFAETFIRPSDALGRMKRRSGDNLEFGYQACGLTLVDQHNCPTNSLPLLWFDSQGQNSPPYVGPYVRVHSRIGEQTDEPAVNKWQDIAKNAEIVRVLSELVKGG